MDIRQFLLKVDTPANNKNSIEKLSPIFPDMSDLISGNQSVPLRTEAASLSSNNFNSGWKLKKRLQSPTLSPSSLRTNKPNANRIYHQQKIKQQQQRSEEEEEDLIGDDEDDDDRTSADPVWLLYRVAVLPVFLLNHDYY